MMMSEWLRPVRLPSPPPLIQVAANSEVNMMNVQNLAVCFGPTLLRLREDEEGEAQINLASIANIKHGNNVIATIIEHWTEVMIKTRL